MYVTEGKLSQKREGVFRTESELVFKEDNKTL